MKLLQTVIEKYFTVKHKGQTYYIDFINSDDVIAGQQKPMGSLD